MHTYYKNDFGTFTVCTFHGEKERRVKSFFYEKDAAKYVHYLNGGKDDPNP